MPVAMNVVGLPQPHCQILVFKFLKYSTRLVHLSRLLNKWTATARYAQLVVVVPRRCYDALGQEAGGPFPLDIPVTSDGHFVSTAFYFSVTHKQKQGGVIRHAAISVCVR